MFKKFKGRFTEKPFGLREPSAGATGPTGATGSVGPTGPTGVGDVTLADTGLNQATASAFLDPGVFHKDDCYVTVAETGTANPKITVAGSSGRYVMVPVDSTLVVATTVTGRTISLETELAGADLPTTGRSVCYRVEVNSSGTISMKADTGNDTGTAAIYLGPQSNGGTRMTSLLPAVSTDKLTVGLVELSLSGANYTVNVRDHRPAADPMRTGPLTLTEYWTTNNWIGKQMEFKSTKIDEGDSFSLSSAGSLYHRNIDPHVMYVLGRPRHYAVMGNGEVDLLAGERAAKIGTSIDGVNFNDGYGWGSDTTGATSVYRAGGTGIVGFGASGIGSTADDLHAAGLGYLSVGNVTYFRRQVTLMIGGRT